ncbi:hypothetical protein QE152_g5892 [Popillia japonica]|uniref:Uncharacterized protein n=1 Tax=Popillia japonica TaxID=7064 RepID=A0AAW1MJQ8_POPJA
MQKGKNNSYREGIERISRIVEKQKAKKFLPGNKERFAEYFEELLNKEEGETRESQYDPKEEQEDAEVETTLMVPTKKEVEDQIESLRSNKAT